MRLDAVFLVAGFGGFGAAPRNPSGDMAVALDGRDLGGMRVAGIRLAVSWASAWRELSAAVDRVRPAGIVLMGVAPSPFARLELLAVNAAFPERDIEGALPVRRRRLLVHEGAPAAYWSSFDLDELHRRLRENTAVWGSLGEKGRVGVELWAGAGSYLCNFVFFHALHAFGDRVPIAFVHVPPYEYMAHPEAYFSETQMTAAAESLVGAGAVMVRSRTAWVSPETPAGVIDAVALKGSAERLSRDLSSVVRVWRRVAATSADELIERMRAPSSNGERETKRR